VPPAVILLLVSSQTGFNHHLRYVLPAFPFAFIAISRVCRAADLGHRRTCLLASLAFAWSLQSSLFVYPHSLSYFNEAVGGPAGGHYHLGNSNVDWGQDLLYLKRWLQDHPEAHPLSLAYDMPLIDPTIVGIQWSVTPRAPQPGWHAASINLIHDRHQRYEYFLDFRPVGRAGHSIWIYHLTPEDVARWQTVSALSPLPSQALP